MLFNRLSYFNINFFKELISKFTVLDAVDIFLVACIIYWIIILIRDTRAEQLTKGIVLLVIANLISDFLNLHTFNYILSHIIRVGTLALVVVFQPELRHGLEQIGRSKIGKILFESKDKPDKTYEKISTAIREIVNSCHIMSERRIGALIIIERETKLADIMNTGVKINADVSSQLIINIFTPNTPLHDGAIVVRENILMSAACFLPLTQFKNLSYELGTRHRAAMGISEVSDCVAIVVSEETGKISISINGRNTGNLTSSSLLRVLNNILDVNDI